MKSAEAKKLIGQPVEWEEAHDRHRGTCLVRHDILKEVKGRNVRFRDRDWRWLPDLVNFKRRME